MTQVTNHVLFLHRELLLLKASQSSVQTQARKSNLIILRNFTSVNICTYNLVFPKWSLPAQNEIWEYYPTH